MLFLTTKRDGLESPAHLPAQSWRCRPEPGLSMKAYAYFPGALSEKMNPNVKDQANEYNVNVIVGSA